VAMLLKLQLSIAAVHGLYFAGMIRAHVARQVTWRGARYAVEGRWNIRSFDAGPPVDADGPGDPEQGVAASRHGFGP